MVITTKKTRGLQKDKRYMLSLASSVHMLLFMWEEVYIELRKLEEINGKRKKNILSMKSIEREEKVNPN